MLPWCSDGYSTEVVHQVRSQVIDLEVDMHVSVPRAIWRCRRIGGRTGANGAKCWQAGILSFYKAAGTALIICSVGLSHASFRPIAEGVVDHGDQEVEVGIGKNYGRISLLKGRLRAPQELTHFEYFPVTTS